MSSGAKSRTLEGDVHLVELVGRGWTDERIARHLGVGRATVQRRLQRIARELGASSRVTIVVRALQTEAVSCRDVLLWVVEATPSPRAEGDRRESDEMTGPAMEGGSR